MNKSIKVIAVILVACLIIAVPLLVRENMPDENEILSGNEDILKIIDGEDVSEITENNDLLEDTYIDDEDGTEVKSEADEETGFAPEPETEEVAVPQNDEEVETPKEESFVENNENITTCSLAINCQSVLDNMDKLKDSKKGVIPESGIFFQAQNIEFNDGESAFDVLQRELQKNEISLDYVKTPFYDSVYIKGIGNLYEFDCGDMSGWLYKVNGEKQSYGCSQYKLKNNDKIEFYYTCNYLDER